MASQIGKIKENELDCLTQPLYPMKRTPSFEDYQYLKDTKMYRLWKLSYFNLQTTWPFKWFGRAKRPRIDYYNSAEYISVNRRIYDHLEGMIPATTQKLLDMPNRAATVRQFSYC